MRILITTGVFEPDIGGPATYAHMLATGLVTKKEDVVVLTFSDSKYVDTDARYPFTLRRIVRSKNKILNRIKFLFVAAPYVWRAHLVYTLDWFAVGFPVAILAALFRKPYIVRVGGDYLWEQRYLESGQEPVSLREFYDKRFHQRHEYRSFYSIINRVLSNAIRVVFNSDKQRELYLQYYDLDPHKVATIENPVPSVNIARGVVGRKEFVFWGRLIVMKNVASLVRAFAKARIPGYTLVIIGEGPRREELHTLIRELGMEDRITMHESMPRDAVLERVKDSRAFVLPSWTDIAPNQVHEALALGLPALVTKENYLRIAGDLPETIDPHSIDDIAAKMEMLADDKKYKIFSESFRKISYKHSTDDVLRQHLELFKQI